MPLVDLEELHPAAWESYPVVWVDCPSCGRGLKSNWFLGQDGSECGVCGTRVRWLVVSHLEVLVHTNARKTANARINRSGSGWFNCQGEGCDESLNVGWVMHDPDYRCDECGTHHHIEVVFGDLGEPESDREVLCLWCGEWVPEGLMNEHHVSYDPEKIVHLCRECHTTVHCRDGPLTPDEIPEWSF